MGGMLFREVGEVGRLIGQEVGSFPIETKVKVGVLGEVGKSESSIEILRCLIYSHYEATQFTHFTHFYPLLRMGARWGHQEVGNYLIYPLLTQYTHFSELTWS